MAADGGVNVFTEEEGWDVLEDIPNNSAAALVLLEHHWAVPLRDAIVRAGGFRISDGFISPLNLVEIGLMEADEAKMMHDLETSGRRKQTMTVSHYNDRQPARVPGGMKCSEPAESPAAPGGAPPGVFPAAKSVGEPGERRLASGPASRRLRLPGLAQQTARCPRRPSAGSFAVLLDDPRLGVAIGRQG